MKKAVALAGPLQPRGVLERIGMQGPQTEAKEQQPGEPGQRLRGNPGGEPDPERAGQGVVEEGGDENAENDRARLAQPGGEGERQQLGLVADLGQRDQRGRRQEGIHGRSA